MSAPIDCPICMDCIESTTRNCVTTECGHCFHTNCLMQSVAHNGFGCPYCRTAMAEVPEEEETDYGDDEEMESVFGEYALTSFRMFHQQINGEEIEEEPAEEWESIDDSEEGESEEDAEDLMPDAAYMAQKLADRGITMEDLIKSILFQEHSNYGILYADYERRSSEVYGQFRAVITQYEPTSAAVQANPQQVVRQIEPKPITRSSLDFAAQPKLNNVSIRRYSECC